MTSFFHLLFFIYFLDTKKNLYIMNKLYKKIQLLKSSSHLFSMYLYFVKYE